MRDGGSVWSEPPLQAQGAALVIDGGYELVRPRFKRTVVDKDVEPVLLLNLDPR